MPARRRPAARSRETVTDANRTTRASAPRGPFRLPGDGRGDDGKTGDACSAWFCAVCDIDDAPEWMVFNPHIRSGYRVGARWLGATRSVFMRHNETVNIWTHLLGFLMFVALIVRTYQTASSGVGLAAPPEHWVTGADVARVAETNMLEDDIMEELRVRGKRRVDTSFGAFEIKTLWVVPG